MSKSIQAPKAPQKEPQPKNLKPAKTYHINDKSQTRSAGGKIWMLWIFGIILFIIIILTTITFISGPITLNWVNPPRIEIPKETNSNLLAITLPSQNLIKHIQINVNNKRLTLNDSNNVNIPLQEGINNLIVSYLYDFKLFKFKSLNAQFQVIKDTIAPQLLKKPTLTNQGLVLEFTEPATIKLNNNTYKTDNSYTTVIPQKALRSNTLNLTVSDKLGNTKHIKIILKKIKASNKNSKYTVTGNTLPESAGLQDFLTIPSLALAIILIGMPYIIVNLSLKRLYNKA